MQQIGPNYIVQKTLGTGGFGVVYLVYSIPEKTMMALKTYRDDYSNNEKITRQFRQEAEIWIRLGHHPHILSAYRVDEIEDRLYIAIEYIPENEGKTNTLEGYYRHFQGPCDPVQTIQWAIQICEGMEYAYEKGLVCHRDLKPANIMITPQNIIKITDFGLADAFRRANGVPKRQSMSHVNQIDFSSSLMHGHWGGTITHMAPEQFNPTYRCDQRSDIYSFGITLFQMATGGRLPFFVPLPHNPSFHARVFFEKEMFRLHSTAPVPIVESPFFPIIQKCLEKAPGNRYQRFSEIHDEIESLLHKMGGEIIEIPQVGQVEFEERYSQGINLIRLQRYRPAANFFDQALAINPFDIRCLLALAECNIRLERYDDAISVIHRAIMINPDVPDSWFYLGECYTKQGAHEQALVSYDECLERNPQYYRAHQSKIKSLCLLGREEELPSITPQSNRISDSGQVWIEKGIQSAQEGDHEKALEYFDRALAVNPEAFQPLVFKGLCFLSLGRLAEAIPVFRKCLNIKADENIWMSKGLCHYGLHQYAEALECYSRALELSPFHIKTLHYQGMAFESLGRLDDAIASYEKAFQTYPKFIKAGLNLILILIKKGDYQKALTYCNRMLDAEPHNLEAAVMKGRCLAMSKKRDDALLWFEDLILKHCDNDQLWVEKGIATIQVSQMGNMTLYDMNTVEAALRCFDEALRINKDNINALLQKGKICQDLLRYDEALGCFEKIIASNPREIRGWEGQALTLADAGRFKEALACTEQGLVIHPGSKTLQIVRKIALQRGG